ncbi:MAG: pyridoxal-phosphate dependent enzyme [Thermoanaerobaculia bacterium]
MSLPSQVRDALQHAGIDVRAASNRVAPFVRATETRRLHWLEPYVGVPVWAKLENHQATGSFKLRGAVNRLIDVPAGTTVIAASAGNHGLAVAHAANVLGLMANICVPVNASGLKRDRITALGAGLVEQGASVAEARGHALALARRHGWTFISPFNDAAIVSGQGTAILEFLKDCPELTTLVIQIGGGGLLGGALGAVMATGTDATVFGCEPARHASMKWSLEGRRSTVPPSGTLADGLATDLEPGSITLDLARAASIDIVSLDEAELAAGVAALLVHESLLVEAAGAAPVVAALRLARMGRLHGPVGIVLSGGNIHHSTLARALGWPQLDPEILTLLDLRGRSTARTPLVRLNDPAPAQQIPLAGKSLAEDLVGLRAQLVGHLDDQARALDAFQVHCRDMNLDTPAQTVTLLETLTDLTRTFAHAAPEGPAPMEELAIRVGMNVYSALSGGLEWCSPAYSQAVVPQFFDLAAQDNGGVNYERYGHSETARIEAQLQDVLNIPPDRWGVMVTSSGMAAYTLIEGLLLRHRVDRDTAVVTAPYIYFEAAEQLEQLPIDVHRAPGWAAADIANLAADTDARLVLADPLANIAEQRLVDVAELIQLLHPETTLLVDGSMMPGGALPGLLSAAGSRHLLYYESCSKYLQLGLDMAMAGVVVHPVELRPVLARLRRNMGLALTRAAARLFPVYGREQFLARIVRMERAATFVAGVLSTHPAVVRQAAVVHPSLPTHPDASLAAGLGRTGGCVTFVPDGALAAGADPLNVLIDHILASARARRVPLVKGVSFGFSVHRLCAASAMAEETAPFLRLSVGDVDEVSAVALAEIIAEGFASYEARVGGTG